MTLTQQKYISLPHKKVWMKAPSSGTTVPLSTGTQHLSSFGSTIPVLGAILGAASCSNRAATPQPSTLHSRQHKEEREAEQNVLPSCQVDSLPAGFLSCRHLVATSGCKRGCNTFHQLHFHHKCRWGLPLKEDGNINTGRQQNLCHTR